MVKRYIPGSRKRPSGFSQTDRRQMALCRQDRARAGKPLRTHGEINRKSDGRVKRVNWKAPHMKMMCEAAAEAARERREARAEMAERRAMIEQDAEELAAISAQIVWPVVKRGRPSKADLTERERLRREADEWIAVRLRDA